MAGQHNVSFSTATIELPEEVIVNLTKMTDDLLKNPNTPDHGQNLAGVINDEKSLLFSLYNITSSLIKKRKD